MKKIEEEMPKLNVDRGNHRHRRTARQDVQKFDKAVAEVYSPPRITRMAKQMGLSTAWALDLTENDPDDGQPWDLSKPEKRKKAMQLQDRDKPLMVIASPMCGPFSTLQNLNLKKVDPEERRKAIAEAILHLRFTAILCNRQARDGRLFMAEHPVGAAS